MCPAPKGMVSHSFWSSIRHQSILGSGLHTLTNTEMHAKDKELTSVFHA